MEMTENMLNTQRAFAEEAALKFWQEWQHTPMESAMWWLKGYTYAHNRECLYATRKYFKLELARLQETNGLPRPSDQPQSFEEIVVTCPNCRHIQFKGSDICENCGCT